MKNLTYTYKTLGKTTSKRLQGSTYYLLECYLEAILPVSRGSNRASVILEQSCQSHLPTTAPVSHGNNWLIASLLQLSLGNNRASPTWEQCCQCHQGKFVTVSLGNYCASLTWEQLCQSHLRTIMPVSLENNRVIITWEHSYQSHLGTIVQVLLENNRASVTWKESCQLPKACNFIKKRVSGKGVFPWILQNF